MTYSICIGILVKGTFGVTEPCCKIPPLFAAQADIAVQTGLASSIALNTYTVAVPFPFFASWAASLIAGQNRSLAALVAHKLTFAHLAVVWAGSTDPV